MLKYVALAAAVCAVGAGTASATTTVVNGSCAAITTGCLFNGNITSQASGTNGYLAAQNAFNLYNDMHPTAGADITLTALFASNDPGFPGSLTGGTGASGTWSLPGYLVDFIAVKASNQFVLYKITPASSGNWDTFSIPFRQNPHALSHLVFFGTKDTGSVPEPASWAMMLGGFGMIGGALRSRRNTAVSFG